MAKPAAARTIDALKVRQWLRRWDQLRFDPAEHRAKPEPHFYIFSMPATELRSLCGIFRRETSGIKVRASDLGIQRRHDAERSEEIGRFVEYGYPWSTLSEPKRESGEYDD